MFIAAGAYAQSDPVSRSWNEPVEPFRIVENIYYVGASDVTSFLITSPGGHVLIDGGFEETAPMILTSIRRLGFRPSDVKVLLNSHAHYDHAGGLAALKRATGAVFYASAPEVPLLARGGKDDPQFGDRFFFPPIQADRILRHGERVTVGASTITANVTPGHTPGCTTWSMKAGKLNVVFFCSPTVPEGYKLVGNPRYPNALADYRKQFRILRSLPCDVFLASHGNFFNLKEKMAKRTGGGTNPFIDREGCHRFIAASELRVERVAAEQGRN